MKEARLLALVIVLSAPGLVWGGPGDPELLPGFNRAAPAPRPLPKKEAPQAAPAPEPAAELQIPEIARPPKRRPVLEEEGRSHRPKLVLRSRAWLTSGSLDTRFTSQVPPDQVSPPGVAVSLGKTSEHRASGLMLVHSAELAPWSWLSLEVEYGRDKHSGSYSGRYWVDAKNANPLTYNPNGSQWSHPDHEDDLITGSDLTSRREWVSGTLYLRAWDGAVASTEYFRLRDTLDIGLGGHRYRQYSHMTGSLRVLSNQQKYFAPGLPAGALPPVFNSSYEGAYSGPHIALRDEVSGFYDCALEALFVYSPLMSYRGSGFDYYQEFPLTTQGAPLTGLLRNYSPNFTDTAGGTAVHFALTGSWAWKYLRLEAGYQRLYFFTRTGKRRYYLADGSHTDVALDFATAELGGFFGGLSLRF